MIVCTQRANSAPLPKEISYTEKPTHAPVLKEIKDSTVRLQHRPEPHSQSKRLLKRAVIPIGPAASTLYFSYLLQITVADLAIFILNLRTF